jgi:AcrR family transcriptional regulator
MTRPSRNQDLILINAAKKMLPKTGLSGMSLKLLAETCGVNLGMFHYHFGSKKNFIKKVLESISKDILDEVKQQSLSGKTSLDRLRFALTAFGLHVREHRKIFTSMIQDVLNREKEVSEFMADFMSREMEILLPLFKAAQKDGTIEKLPYRQCVSFCMSSIMIPTLMNEAISRINKRNLHLKEIMSEDMASDFSIQQRVDMALKALSTKPRKIL